MRASRLACAGVLPLLWCCAAAALGPPFYIAKRFEATVIDESTGKPVSGAIVVAHWELVDPASVRSRDREQLEVRETVTDAIGGFAFDGFVRGNPKLYELRERDPQIIVFKDGYEFTVVSNRYDAGNTRTPGIRRISQHHLGQVRIKPFEGTSAEYARHLKRLKDHFHFAYRDCNWTRAPLLTAALLEKSEWFGAQGVRGTLATLDEVERAGTCEPAGPLLKPLRDN